MGYETHASRALREEVEKTAKRAPTARERAQYQEWEREKRIQQQNAANDAAEQ